MSVSVEPHGGAVTALRNTVRLMDGGSRAWQSRSVRALIAAFPSKIMMSSSSLRTAG
jgi:hypothetical protein